MKHTTDNSTTAPLRIVTCFVGIRSLLIIAKMRIFSFFMLHCPIRAGCLLVCCCCCFFFRLLACLPTCLFVSDSSKPSSFGSAFMSVNTTENVYILYVYNNKCLRTMNTHRVIRSTWFVVFLEFCTSIPQHWITTISTIFVEEKKSVESIQNIFNESPSSILWTSWSNLRKWMWDSYIWFLIQFFLFSSLFFFFKYYHRWYTNLDKIFYH